MSPDADFPSDLRSLERDYELIRELGQGGMAAVYLARHRDSGRMVAIKAIRSRYLDDPDAIQRFAREARTVAGLDHPNIIRTEAIEQIGDRAVAIIMEHAAGGTVRDRLREFGSLGAEEAESILRDVASALGYAHRHGIVHRDVKPENIFLDPNRRRALLSDFGIARKIDTDAGITLLGAALGTPQYMSPEQIDGEKVDGRSDIYSLGVLGWELLTGRRPWAGESLYGVIYKQKHEELPRITSLRPRVPANLLFAIEGALLKDRARRWQTVDEFLDQLTYNPPPLLSQTYPPGVMRADHELTVRFRPAALEPDGAAGEVVADASDDLVTSVVVPAPDVEDALAVAERPSIAFEEPDAPMLGQRVAEVAEPAYSSGGYVLPQFGPNAEMSIDVTRHRTRIAQAVGLLVPLGIAAAAAFIVLGGSASDSGRRSRAPSVTTSAGVLAPDSGVATQFTALPTTPDTMPSVTRDAAAPPKLTGIVVGSSTGSTAKVVAPRTRLSRKSPVFASTRVGGSTTATVPLPPQAGSIHVDTNRAVMAARPSAEPNESAAAAAVPTRDAGTPSRPGTEAVSDPFKIPASRGESAASLGRRGSVPTGRCVIATTADQRACLDAYVAAGDIPLVGAFDALVVEMRRVAHTAPGAPDPGTVQHIKVEQRAWLSIRESECPRQAPAGAGSFWAQGQAECFNDMAKSRAAELRDAVKRLKRK